MQHKLVLKFKLQMVVKPGTHWPQASVCLVSRNQFCADVGMHACVCVCVRVRVRACVRACEATTFM